MARWPSYTKVWHTSPYSSISPSRPELSLAGRSVVITGGGSGIGASIAQSVALAGASKIAIIGRRTQALSDISAKIKNLVGSKTQVFTFSADVANKEQVDAAFSQITTHFDENPLDILINNAGFFTGLRPLGTETVEEWTTNFDVNVKGVYLITTAFIARARPDATIINISTAITHLSPFPGFTSYAATKLAGAKMMDYVRQENPQMFVVNVHPGQVGETDMAGKARTNEDIPAENHIDDGKSHLMLRPPPWVSEVD